MTPRPPGGAHGNSVTVERWAAILTGLGHRVELVPAYQGRPAGLLVAPARPAQSRVTVALPGGEPAGPRRPGAHRHRPVPRADRADRPALELADRLVVLQPLGLAQLSADLRSRAAVIHQSAAALSPRAPAPSVTFDGVLLANLRRLKDPLLAARATRRFPARSSIRVRHAGVPLDRRLGRLLELEGTGNRHYEWLGELSRPDARRARAASRLLLLISRNEGGANVVSEALADPVPVVATRIPGTVGILGTDYPGYFPVGDVAALAEPLRRVEADRDLYRELRRRCVALRSLVRPEKERASWQRLLEGLGGRPPPPAAGC